MKKTLTATLLSLASICTHAQDFALKVSPQLSVSLPSSPDTSRIESITIYKVTTADMAYQLGMDTKVMNIETEADFGYAMKGFYHGFEPNLAGFSVIKKDSVIGGVKGVVLHASKTSSFPRVRLDMFYTVVDKHCYFIQCSSLPGVPPEKVAAFFNTVKFSGKNYRNSNPDSDSDSDSDTYSIAFKFGQVIGYLISIGVFIILVLLVVKAIRRIRK